MMAMRRSFVCDVLVDVSELLWLSENLRSSSIVEIRR